MRKFIVPSVSAVMILGLAALAPAQKKGDAAKGKEVFEQCAVCHNVDNDEKKIGKIREEVLEMAVAAPHLESGPDGQGGESPLDQQMAAPITPAQR